MKTKTLEQTLDKDIEKLHTKEQKLIEEITEMYRIKEKYGPIIRPKAIPQIKIVGTIEHTIQAEITEQKIQLHYIQKIYGWQGYGQHTETPYTQKILYTVSKEKPLHIQRKTSIRFIETTYKEYLKKLEEHKILLETEIKSYREKIRQ